MIAETVFDRVADRVWMAAPKPGDGTMTVVATTEGKVVVDTTSYPVFAQQVREAIDREVSGPWRYVINTHRHFDHVGGNQVFQDCVFIAPELTREAMQGYTTMWLESRIAEWEKADGFKREWMGPDFRLRLPDVSYKDTLTLYLGSITFRLMKLGGHNPECSVVFLEEPRILIASDLVFNGKAAYLGEGDRWQWLNALQSLMRLRAAIVIPGHGPAGGAELLQEQANELRAREE